MDGWMNRWRSLTGLPLPTPTFIMLKANVFNNESSIQQYSDSVRNVVHKSFWWATPERYTPEGKLHQVLWSIKVTVRHVKYAYFLLRSGGVQVMITVAEQSSKQSDVAAVEGHFSALQKRMRSFLSRLGLEGSQEWTRNSSVKLKHIHPPFHPDPHQNIVDESLVHSSSKFYVVIP